MRSFHSGAAKQQSNAAERRLITARYDFFLTKELFCFSKGALPTVHLF